MDKISSYSPDKKLLDITKKMFIVSIILGIAIAIFGILMLCNIMRADILAPGAYNAPFNSSLIHQVFGCSLILMGFLTFDIGKSAYLGIKQGRMTRFFPIHDFVLLVLSFMGIICCAGKGSFGLIYLFCLLYGIIYLLIAVKNKYPMDLG